MKSEDLQRQIESMQNSLRRASANLPPNDPALGELKRIVQRKIEEVDCAAEEEMMAPSDCILFAEYEEELEEQGSWRYGATRSR